MGFGNYSNGFREGILIRGAGMFDAGYGRVWYVDAKTGADGNSGKRRDRPFLTMSKAFQQLDSGDTIVFRGKIREQLVSPAGVFDVTVIGDAPSPRHADDHTESGGARGSSAATWTAPASGSTSTALVRVQQQGWNFHKIVFQISGSATACAESYKTADSGDDERDGGHARFFDCRFQGSGSGGIGFHRDGGNGYCRVIRCTFQSLAEGIGHTAGDGGADAFHVIEDCFFEGNTKHIIAPLSDCRILRNTFGRGATVDFDLTGGAFNDWDGNKFLKTSVFENNVAGTSDLIIGRNWSADTGSDDVDDTSGVITAAPNGS